MTGFGPLLFAEFVAVMGAERLAANRATIDRVPFARIEAAFTATAADLTSYRQRHQAAIAAGWFLTTSMHWLRPLLLSCLARLRRPRRSRLHRPGTCAPDNTRGRATFSDCAARRSRSRRQANCRSACRSWRDRMTTAPCSPYRERSRRSLAGTRITFHNGNNGDFDGDRA